MNRCDVRVKPRQLHITFMDGREDTFTVTNNHWIDDGVLRFRCGDDLYALPLVGIRFWRRELGAAEPVLRGRP